MVNDLSCLNVLCKKTLIIEVYSHQGNPYALSNPKTQQIPRSDHRSDRCSARIATVGVCHGTTRYLD